MKIVMTSTFKKAAKKLHRNQIAVLEKTIDKIIHEPNLGELKIGDLAGVRVYKFSIHHQLKLLVYRHNEKPAPITLLAIAPHENFYANLKKQIND